MSDWINHNGAWELNGVPCKVAPIQIKAYGEGFIPWDVAVEAYKEYSAKYGTSQTLERLCERGGFTPSELAILLYERIKSMEAKCSA